MAELGPLGAGASQVTIEELGDFTAGYPSDPTRCTKGMAGDPPGCIPNDRPTTDQYTAGDFLTYFQNFPPQVGPPAPYYYSDISTGLIGLLLGATPGQLIDNSALDGWYALVTTRITEVLGMKDTFLDPTKATPSQQRRAASRYQQALATATVAGGQVTAINQTSVGSAYPDSSGQPPTVIIRGGGGTGAKAHANLVGAGEVALMLDDGGKNYVAPPEVEFTGGSSPTPAKASAIISRGRVVGIRMLQGGGGYQADDQVTANITGGNRGRFSRDAVLGKVTISNGNVDFVKVVDGGRGYVDPIAVIVGPTAPAQNNIPIWAAAGALNSTAVDMLQFAEAALGHVDGRNRSDRLLLREGFRLAQQSYTCQTADPDNPNECVIGSGLAWAIARANGGVGKIITKNGGIGGFSTEIHIVPSLDLGIIVLVNSRQNIIDDKTTPPSTQPSKPAESIANSILYAIARVSGFRGQV